jgi:dipeptidyl-peptidase 4
MRFRLSFILLAAVLVFSFAAGCGEKGPSAGVTEGGVTARQLEAPNALVGPGPSGLSWSPAGARLSYVMPEGDGQALWLYDAAGGRKELLLDPAEHDDDIDVTTAQWSPRGDSMLLSGEKSMWVLDVDSGDLKALEGDAGGATATMFAPSGKTVSYVKANDIYTIGVDDGRTERLTTDGGKSVYNGCLDWVYTEELATRDAQPGYAWSPDGKGLFYMRLDDSAVQDHPVTDYDPVPPTTGYTRYPVAGSANPEASLHFLSPGSGAQARPITLPQDTEYVLPFFTWTPDSKEAVYITVNREHSVLRLNAWNSKTGGSRVIIEETDPHWINEDLYVAPTFLPGGRFLWLSERDGYMHLYLYSTKGDLIRQVTSGDWLVDTLAYDVLSPGKPVFVIPPARRVHVDPSGTWAYFTSTKNSPIERQIYRVNVESGKLQQLTKKSGFHSVALSGDGKYLVDQFSSLDTPPVTAVARVDGSKVEVLAECAGPSLDLPEVKREFLTVKAHDGTELYAQMVKPEDFDPGKRYGVVVHWYGGPGLQLVTDRYGTTSIFNSIERDVLYTERGFIVWRLDNRGSYGRGHAFETPIDGQLGPLELDDQIAGIEYLKSLPYIDGDRIGCDGKSFGGFMTLYALIKRPDIFKCGVAGSGPTRWDYYDTIYTERYMGLPDENREGYSSTDLISVAADIGREPLIIHGLDDTNVHLQNSVNFMQALEHSDKTFQFIPLPNEDHHYEGDGLVTVLSASQAYFAANLR